MIDLILTLNIFSSGHFCLINVRINFYLHGARFMVSCFDGKKTLNKIKRKNPKKAMNRRPLSV